MKLLLKLEELAQLLACLYVLNTCHAPWWCYGLLLIGPDIGMLGYLVSTRVGAVTYNLFHHKGLALLVGVAGCALAWTMVRSGMKEFGYVGSVIASAILYGHSCLDRMLGYGLKFGDHFQHTHLGWIGKARSTGEQ
ncbi:MAG TPA: DUF4260 domain-containing protein [Flavobacteriales bacterium]|jgi:hypothetical protein|nr:DUF4260 domain-containing protein [Flavobacteriales bacterium]